MVNPRHRRGNWRGGSWPLGGPTLPPPSPGRLLLQTKAWIEGLIFNGSQHWSCSATYETLTQNQVVYE